MHRSDHDSAYSWLRLALSLAVGIVGTIGMWAVVVVLPEMQAEFGLDRADATFPYIFSMIGFAAGNLLLGGAVDRWGITPVLVVAGLISALGKIYLIAALIFCITVITKYSGVEGLIDYLIELFCILIASCFVVSLFAAVYIIYKDEGGKK